MVKEGENILGLKNQIIFGYIASTIFFNFYTHFYNYLLSPFINKIIIKFLNINYEEDEKKIKVNRFISEVIKTLLSLIISFLIFKYKN